MIVVLSCRDKISNTYMEGKEIEKYLFCILYVQTIKISIINFIIYSQCQILLFLFTHDFSDSICNLQIYFSTMPANKS